MLAQDDDRSTRVYGGYTLGARDNLLSAANAVIVTNSIIATVALSALIRSLFQITALAFLPFGIVIFVLVYVVHGLLGTALSRGNLPPEYGEVRFPTPNPAVTVEASQKKQETGG